MVVAVTKYDLAPAMKTTQPLLTGVVPRTHRQLARWSGALLWRQAHGLCTVAGSGVGVKVKGCGWFRHG